MLTRACIVREASTNKKYEEKMHIEARKTIILTLLPNQELSMLYGGPTLNYGGQ